jgi:hypothetical protein
LVTTLQLFSQALATDATNKLDRNSYCGHNISKTTRRWLPPVAGAKHAVQERKSLLLAAVRQEMLGQPGVSVAVPRGVAKRIELLLA